jgi:hypothetical protein
MDLVHLAPYDAGDAADVKVICSVISSWCKAMPKASRDLLMKNAKALGLASHGAIGQLANIILKAEKLRVSRKGDVLLAQDLEESLPYLNQLRRGEQEISAGRDHLDRLTLTSLMSVDPATPKQSRFGAVKLPSQQAST